ncbi:DUF4148 domain-containing protein [Cupriavidus plantarum]|uniref:Uncharacterized protein DUF4148 n=1 Tax=Cupriavidus plantarum TaxID=942865 RepID=A0A316F8Y0_9BURK|nr:DUF4148 domain-containing protein [Cupriavidus plantarum]PWK33545.1 uncharacterized protein DUF4148 [Cupriavidus plantarum]REE87544.1 uncharacterized protein DUF4148 [Cupriavidus plantarum]RLK29978.1 uncharacterized protein DUF4148 [Cupriavidus plantarum]
MKRLISVTLLASALAPAAALAADPPYQGAPRGLTREEVRADLEAWEKAGLRNRYRGDGAPPFFDPSLQKQLAEYQRLRATTVPATAPPSSGGG